ELEDFLLGKEGRVEETTTQKPIILNEYLFEKNKGMQDTLTHWVAPEHIKVIQIVGWGLNTIKGIEYYEREKMKCSLGFINCRKENTLDYRPLITVEGDETVVYPSANYLEAETY